MFRTEINVQIEKKKNKSTNLHGKVSGEVLFYPGGKGNGVNGQTKKILNKNKKIEEKEKKTEKSSLCRYVIHEQPLRVYSLWRKRSILRRPTLKRQ